ncbi:hypothetical protein [Maridesulfovibrio bastinii]|uniref:hypothetical protein n=1 Tax=Maridesulfovibrio bastinii TaxID=47157 RepID=UPI00040F61E9|nr:hypothetical protein [Maridesulfovibrio bastinii]
MQEKQIREYIHSIVMEKCTHSEEARKDALKEFIAMTMPNLDENAINTVKDMIPPITALYDKWANMFIDRLLETIPEEQIQELCNGTPDNKSALILVYIMFMESERMEKQIAEDISEYASTQNDEAGNLASEYIRAKLMQIAENQKAADKKLQ